MVSANDGRILIKWISLSHSFSKKVLQIFDRVTMTIIWVLSILQSNFQTRRQIPFSVIVTYVGSESDLRYVPVLSFWKRRTQAMVRWIVQGRFTTHVPGWALLKWWSARKTGYRFLTTVKTPRSQEIQSTVPIGSFSACRVPSLQTLRSCRVVRRKFVVTWWNLANCSWVPAVALVTIRRLDKNGTVTKALSEHLPANVIESYSSS